MDIQYIFFDLDGTLYTDNTGLFTQVGNRIHDWLIQKLDISMEEAQILRQQYNRAYGTTMSGIRHHHPELDADEFLDYVHDVDVTPFLNPTPELNAMLDALPTRKIVFTNSIADWAERITRQLGIRHHFEEIFDVRDVQYKSKPHPFAYEHVITTLRTSADRCIMLDDQLSYIKGAQNAGLGTVWVHPEANADEGLDAYVRTITEAGPILQDWLQA